MYVVKEIYIYLHVCSNTISSNNIFLFKTLENVTDHTNILQIAPTLDIIMSCWLGDTVCCILLPKHCLLN